MRRIVTAMTALAVLVFGAGCRSPFEGSILVALKVEGEPARADWDRTVPVDLAVWRGNVNVREEMVALDRETSHISTPECHHGPSTSDPVPVRIRALYNGEELFLSARWKDATRDTELGSWERTPEGWTARPDADDGIAFLWEQGQGTPFRCQLACHLVEVDVFDGGTQMRMAMKNAGESVWDLWRWRSGVTGPFGQADDMVVDHDGKRGDEGLVLPTVNRSERGGGPAVAKGDVTPFYIARAAEGRQADVTARGRWEDGWWEVLFRRSLDTGDPDDVILRPGGWAVFGVSVFDNTWTEHHVLDSGVQLLLWDGTSRAADEWRDLDEAMDF
ncbi:MAG: hypothetical protein JSV00_04725 [bacterium]|nr:MAG: hypothetical protein JSV00_04725 [bacterium]